MIVRQGQVSEERLTTELAVRAMRWRVSPDRYLKADGGWVPRSKFRPLVDVNHAFQALDAVTNDYVLLAKPDVGFEISINLKGLTIRAVGASKPSAICRALAKALGIDVEANS